MAIITVAYTLNGKQGSKKFTSKAAAAAFVTTASEKFASKFAATNLMEPCANCTGANCKACGGAGMTSKPVGAPDGAVGVNGYTPDGAPESDMEHARRLAAKSEKTAVSAEDAARPPSIPADIKQVLEKYNFQYNPHYPFRMAKPGSSLYEDGYRFDHHYSPEDQKTTHAAEFHVGIFPSFWTAGVETGTTAQQLEAVLQKYVSPKSQASFTSNMKEAGFNFFFPGQAVSQFYPELLHDVVDYPNQSNDGMAAAGPDLTGDADLGDAVDAALNPTVIAYVSTSPAGGMGIGRDGKPEVLEGAPLRKENDVRGPMFMEEFHAQTQGIPGPALNVIAKKTAAGEEQEQFSMFLKRVMGEICAAFLAAFKVTMREPMSQVPGIGEVQLANIEQGGAAAGWNLVNTGSRVKYLMDKLNDSDVQDAINDAFCQGAIWCDTPKGGFVYEVFTRAETIDTDSMLMKYKFVCGTRESKAKAKAE